MLKASRQGKTVGSLNGSAETTMMLFMSHDTTDKNFMSRTQTHLSHVTRRNSRLNRNLSDEFHGARPDHIGCTQDLFCRRGLRGKAAGAFGALKRHLHLYISDYQLLC